MIYDPVEVGNHPTVRSMHPQVRAEYFALLRRTDACGVIDLDYAAELLRVDGERAAKTRTDVLAPSEIVTAITALRLLVTDHEAHEAVLFTPAQRATTDALAITPTQLDTHITEVFG